MSKHPDQVKFDQLCKQVDAWPCNCPDDDEWDIMFRASKEAFKEGGIICKALNLLYIRHMMLRTVVDMIIQNFDEQWSAMRSK